MSRYKGAVKIEGIEARYAIRLRVQIPERGLTRMPEILEWLNGRVGRHGYVVRADRHASPWHATTAIFLDDIRAAADLVDAFGLVPAPDPAARAHASDLPAPAAPA